MGNSNLSQQQGILRHRGVLHDGQRRDEQYARLLAKQTRKPGRAPGQRLNLAHLDPEQLAAYPVLLAHVAENGGFAPRVRTGSDSDAAPRRARLEQMYAHAGELALLTWTVPRLDDLPLKSQACARSLENAFKGVLKVYAPRARAWEAAGQRGGVIGGTHVHIVLPLADVARKLQATAMEAPAGRGGGAWHTPGRLHIVRIGDTPEDRARVAGYLSRDPDGRFDLSDDHPDFLQALEEELTRKQGGARSPKLSWYQRIPGRA